MPLQSLGLRKDISTLREAEDSSALSSIFLDKPRVDILNNCIEVKLTTKIDIAASKIALYAHWGPLNDGNQWISEEIGSEDVTAAADSNFCIVKRIKPSKIGSYGITFFAVVDGKKHWLGKPEVDDSVFSIDTSFSKARLLLDYQAVSDRISFKTRLLNSILDYEKFLRFVSGVRKARQDKGIAKLIFDLISGDADLERLLLSHFTKAVDELAERDISPRRKKSLQTLLLVLENIGIGEVVFVAPEGPHASAGGLSQVISGLMKSLDESGLSTTLISPLYEEDQGSKHPSAEELIRQGLLLGDELVPITKVGRVQIPLGPTRYSGTPHIKENAILISAQVYKAESKNMRVYFLRHKRLAARLYPDSSGKEQICHATFLARGALEILRSPRFEINPHIVVSNDWPTALVPVLLKTDPDYLDDEILRDVQTFHILHNCGMAYQGRFYINEYGEDLWPLLGLAGEHFFGICDPNDSRLLNLTAGAIHHVKRALVAVSKPYAEDLLTEDGGEGLHNLFKSKADCVFGISNGVDLESLRHILWQLGEKAKSELNLESVTASKYQQQSVIKNMSTYKQALKLAVQQKYGLTQDKDNILISFVGRLAEQKGIALFTETIKKDGCSLLESILTHHPSAQIFIGGPVALGDSGSKELKKVIVDLIARYPGRIQGIFNFISHREALEITAASDLLLMPSRYEPGGISQLEALATGTIVVARNVGGITATLVDYASEQSQGNAFLFDEYSASALYSAVSRAIETLLNDVERDALRRIATAADNDWRHRLPKYLTMFQYASGVFRASIASSYLSERKKLLVSIRPSVVHNAVSLP
ncbi:MAG: glycogen/starch synthase [Deltaproteobacteria bacterium]|nr:glycogen/starch synthase [Deltaproteobacteria bacterium]